MYYPTYEEFEQLTEQGNLIPVYREVLADMETPVSVLKKLRDRSSSFMLESVEGGEKWGRYSFLGADPKIVFRVRDDKVIIERGNETVTELHHGNPLKYLKNLIGHYKPVSINGCPRFYGGAVGFLGYDMVRYFEELPDQAEKDLDTDDAVFLITDTMIVFDRVRHTIKVIACGFTDENEGLREVYSDCVRRVDEMLSLLGTPEPVLGASEFPDDSAEILFTSNMKREYFEEMVRKAKDYIIEGDIIQVVLSQRFQSQNNCDPLDLYRALRYVNPSPYLFYLKLPELTLIGSSPEVMVRLEEKTVELRPIAGTRKRGKNEQEDRGLADELLDDPKERAEHVMLVDLGRNDLGRIAVIGSVQVTQLMTVERYSHVMHLVSNVQAQLADGMDAFDVLEATFPAGTLSGAPKIRAMEIIDELEPTRRGTYGGAVGYFSFGGNMDFCITIRTIMMKDDKIFIQAGAGIVADSDPTREYQETMNKAEGMKQAIILAKKGFELTNTGRP